MPSGIKHSVNIDCSFKHVQFNQFIDGSIKIYTFPKSKVSIFSGYPLDRMLEPPLDPMYPDPKERNWPMSGRSRDRPPLLDRRGEKYRRCMLGLLFFNWFTDLHTRYVRF